MRRRSVQERRAVEGNGPVSETYLASVRRRYDPQKAAPEVVAKGSDLLAKKIREIAADSGVPVIADPPLARSLHASVEVGHQIPEELYQGVAQLLAFVYRTARRRALA
jgi:flagellar biosynthetic protein FlhB